MGKIRINELARELEVKSNLILEYLVEIGTQEKKSHSSALEDDLADKIRAHFHAEGEPTEKAREVPAAPEPPTPAAEAPHAPPVLDLKKLHELKPEFHPLTRSIAEIKAAARKAVVAPPPPRPPAGPPSATGPVTAPVAMKPVPGLERPAERPMPGAAVLASGAAGAPLAGGGRPAAGRAVPGVLSAKGGAEAPAVPVARAGAGTETSVAGKALEIPPPPPPAGHPKGMRPSRSGRHADPHAHQPIYPQAVMPKPAPARPLAPRRPGEARPMHPTSARPGGAGGAVATGGVPGIRPPGGRPAAPHLRRTAAAPSMPFPRPAIPEEIPITRKITISEGIAIKELSEKLETRAKDVIKRLLDKGIFATINQTLDGQTAVEIARNFGAEATIVSYEEEVLQEVEETDRSEDLKPRAPVVTVMGHVDHGKTSLLDALRETNVAAHEAGGITQSIGAYQVVGQGRKVTFIDTPGHEAFTLMRARGARVTDVVVLVVAADDGVMPQTLEAINHARAAKVPIVVAINKIDKPEAQPERVKRQLADHDLMPEEWGGQTVTVEVSAKQRKNLELLLEMILLVSDLQGLKANPQRLATGTVVEAKLDRGRGPVASVLVQNGTLRVGDSFIVGAIYGKVRALFDDHGRPVIEAPPSAPAEVLGLEDVPQAGDRLQVIEDTLKARQIALHRQAKLREAALAKTARLTLEQLHQQLAAGDVKELPLIIKADVQGSVEVLSETLTKLSTERVKIKVIHAGAGAITESDVLLASASNAVIIGFSVRPERKATELAQLENVDIRLHTVIYNVTEEIKKAMVGLLAITYKETSLGRADVRDTFRITKVGTVAGCYIQDGRVTREAQVRLLRDNVVVYEGKVRSLRRFKDDVAEVKSGMECGISLENFNDVKVGDVIEAYVKERVAEPAIA
ncbi:MAG: translation initiation factor IF-2 [Acidobacteriia bacterium]|nr:translation initiation factor IF-2 [Terriglobia bacterium]